MAVVVADWQQRQDYRNQDYVASWSNLLLSDRLLTTQSGGRRSIMSLARLRIAAAVLPESMQRCASAVCQSFRPERL